MKVVGVREIGKDQYTVSIDGNKVIYQKIGGNSYQITTDDRGITICTCKGFQFHGKCRHCIDFEELAPNIIDILPSETAPVKAEAERIHRDELEDTVDTIVDRFRDEGFTIEPAGSWRRGKPTVKDLDFVTVAEASDVFKLCGEGLVTSASGTKVVRFTVELEEGKEIQVDFAITTPEFFGSCLMYLTGDKDFNVKLRQRAKRMGLKLSRNGLEERKTGEILASRTEADIFKCLGLDIIPPSCREVGRWEEFDL
jgi:DNA polymerase/3'-5' exonuclease PolX